MRKSWTGWTGIKLAVTCLAALGMLAIGSASASATVTEYKFEREFGSFSSPAGVAVDNSAGPSKEDVYVADIGHQRVVKFDAAGTEIEEITAGFSEPAYLTIDSSSGPSAGDLYVSDLGNHTVTKLNEAKTVLCQISESSFPGGAAHAGFWPFGLAVDPVDGDLYVADRTNNMVDVFAEGCTYLSQFEGGGTLDSLAVDNAGNVYTTNQGLGVNEYTPTGTLLRTITANAQSVAVDLSNNDIFIGENAESPSFEIAHYDSAGTLQPPLFGLGHFAGGSFGIAVNSSTHSVYASSIEGGIANIFNSAPVLVDVTTGAAEKITTSTATLTGTIKPVTAPEATGIEFEYGKEGDVEEHKIPASLTSATAEVHVEAGLSALEPGTHYVYRLSATAEGKTIDGAEKPLETLPLATITTESATEVKPESATLNGKLKLNVPVEGEYYFEYLPEGGVPATTTATKFSGEKTVSAPVILLSPETHYHYQLVAVVEGHTIKGSEVEFTTSPLITVKTEAANAFAESAILKAKIDINAGTAKYHFEYYKEGQSPPYATTPVEELSGVGEHVVSANVAGLEPGMVYHFRIVAFAGSDPNPFEGSLEELTTKVGEPVISNESSSQEERHSALVSGEINPKGGETVYYFQYEEAQKFIETKTYTKASATATTPAGVVPVPTGPVELSELNPGTVYYYRLVATNTGGTTYGPPATFETSEPLSPAVLKVFWDLTSPTTVTLKAITEPDGLRTTYALELGADTSYGTPTFGQVPEEPEGQLEFHLTGLLPNTTYHWRLVLTNEDGTFTGADHTFTTKGFSSVLTPPAPVQLVPTPNEESIKPPPPHIETRGEKYAKAVKLCEKIKSKKKRAACMKTANKKYGPVVKKKAKKKKK